MTVVKATQQYNDDVLRTIIDSTALAAHKAAVMKCETCKKGSGQYY